MEKRINEVIKEKISNLEYLKNSDYNKKLIEIINIQLESLKNGGKILIAGNGGSASDAQHFAGELVGRFLLERKALPAIALNTDTSVMTSIGNDYSYDTIFSRQVEALGKKGDIFFGISTSGNSKNIVEATLKAKEQGLITIGLLGRDGGKLKDICDFSLIVPFDSTARIQEVHIMTIHLICELVEKDLKKN